MYTSHIILDRTPLLSTYRNSVNQYYKSDTNVVIINRYYKSHIILEFTTLFTIHDYREHNIVDCTLHNAIHGKL